MNNEELILTTIKKVYAIREAAEKRSDERLSTPLLGYVRVAVSGTSLTRDQQKDVTAYVTASCNTGDKLNIMEKISLFKAKSGVRKPQKILLSYVGLVLPMLLAIAAEAALFLTDRPERDAVHRDRRGARRRRAGPGHSALLVPELRPGIPA